MFESTLEEKLKRIFDVKKVTFAEPGESAEQECIFIGVEHSTNAIKDKRAKAKVTGTISMFGNADKLPFGFFSKRIAQADASDTVDLFFHDFESNTRRYQNLVQRACSFVYFFDSQYDPDTGTITSIDLSTEET